jgi:Ca2+-binding EF-hand superfamily protein
VEAAFRRWDVNKDGSISLDELKSGLKGSGILFTEQEAETCFAVGDSNGDNEVSMEEFVELLSTSSSPSCGPIKKFFNYCVEQAFNNIDTNRDGSLSYEELSGSLRVGGFSDQEIHTIFALADHDGDGEISLAELIRSLSKSS